MTEERGLAGDFSILTACAGNICRSPFAEQYLRMELSGIPQITVSSAGIFAVEDAVMPAEAQTLVGTYGSDPGDHRARLLREQHILQADLVLGMAREHRREVVARVPRASRYSFTLREFARLAEGVGGEQLREIAQLPTDNPASRLRATVALVASRRGTVTIPFDPSDDDVIDPYLRDEAVFALAGRQMVPSANVIVRLFLRAVSAVPAQCGRF